MDGAMLLAAGESGVSGMSAVIAAMTDVTGLIGTIFTLIMGQPVLLFLLAAGLLPIGFKIFRMARSTAGSGGE